MATRMRVRAPELVGAGGWINVDRPLTLAELRGRVVLLDFWTFCCINCIHVVEELRPLERRFGDRLVVIGVHSPKFPHEQDHDAVVRATLRHRITHPVLDDPGMETWQRYAVRAWPTLVLIDQDGYAVATASGEGNAEAVAAAVEQLLRGREAEMPPGPAFTPLRPDAGGELSFPGKVASDGGERLAIADTGHDRVLVTTLDGTLLAEHGGFEQPQGVRFDGDRLLVCDTVAGRLVAVDTASGARQVLASGLSSPWDVVRDGDSLVVAEAGVHRLLRVPAGGGRAEVLAGTRAEGLRDGPRLEAHLAQPSGVTRLADGTIAFADSEVSALRAVRGDDVETLAGEGLFEWGDDDGDAARARLQHPLGVAALEGGGIAVADTFNSRLRVWRDGTLTTLRVDGRLDEPGGLDVLPDGRLVVADTNAHRVVVVDPVSGGVVELRLGPREWPVLEGRPGAVLTLEISLDLGGEDVDPSQGPPVRVSVTAEPATLLAPGPRAWALDSLPAQVEVTLAGSGEGEISVDIIVATCHGDVCSIRRETRRHPLRVSG